jgi:hypothetical protein
MNLKAQIHAVESELVQRERIAHHLRGARANDNLCAMARLYDRLMELHIKRIQRKKES